MPTDGDETNEPLGREIARLMDQAGIGVRELARRTRELSRWDARYRVVDRTTISELRRGIPPRPNAAILVSLARVLGTDPYYLLRLAGVSLPAALAAVEPQTASIAQRLSELPDWLRELAVPAMLDVVAMLERIAATAAGQTSDVSNERLASLLQDLKQRDPVLWRQMVGDALPEERRRVAGR